MAEEKGMRTSLPILAIVSIAFAAGFLLCGYEFIRSASTSLYIEAYGADRLPYAMVAGTVFTALFIYAYGWTLTFIGPRRTLAVSSLFSSLIMVGCYLALRSGVGIASGVAYALREAYIVVIIEQYWSFINSTLREGNAKKLNGPICGVGSLGAMSGGYLVGRLAENIGTEPLLLLAAASLIPALICSDLSYRFGGEPAPAEREQGKKSLALSLFKDSSYLRRIGLLIILTQLISTTFDLRWSLLVEEALPVKDARTAYLGNFYMTLNGIAFALQFIVAPILLSFIALRFIHPAIPIVHVITAAVLILKPTLFTGSFAYLTFKVLDYSIFRAGKEIFYIPLSFDSRYRAKEVIDSFGYRASKGGIAGLASLVRMIFKVIPAISYPSVALASALGWFAAVRKLVHQYDGMLKQNSTDSGE